jgi:hypothetical protein
MSKFVQVFFGLVSVGRLGTEADSTEADIVVSRLSAWSPSADTEVRPKKTL